MPRKQETKSEVIIVGSGLIGLTAAIALASKNISSIIIEAHDFKSKLKQKPDGRSSAIAYGSYAFLKEIGAWNTLADKAGSILDIRITDGNSPLFLHYDHKLVGKEPMGYMLSNNDTWEALYHTANSSKLITLLDNRSWKEIHSDQHQVTLLLENGEKLSASLLLAADGKFSKIRQYFNINTHGWKYPQSGIVCNVTHEKHHHSIAQERFLASGPFAILPLKGGYESSLVWTEKSHLVDCHMRMDEKELTSEISKRFGDYLGKVTLASKVMSYPLSLTNAEHYTAERMALIGDAAHSIHPIAGQGFNLGIRDVEALLPLLAEKKALGYDLGHTEILTEYEKRRRFDAMTLIAITDLLNRLFSNDALPLKVVRNMGLSVVNKLPSLKKLFMKHAMGITQK